MNEDLNPTLQTGAEGESRIMNREADHASGITPHTSRFEPRIVVFACNWCSYAGADFAGVGRMQYPPNIRIIRLMCSGRVNPGFIFRAFEAGADGVLLSGCHPGDCHYAFGNLRARENVEMTKELLHVLGIEPGRFRLEWFTAAEGAKFAQVIKEFVEAVKKLGKSPFGTTPSGGPPWPPADGPAPEGGRPETVAPTTMMV